MTSHSYPRCRCQAPLTADGRCPYGCPPDLAKPRLRQWKARRMEARRAKAGQVEAATGYPGVDETREGAAVALGGGMRVEDGVRR